MNKIFKNRYLNTLFATLVSIILVLIIYLLLPKREIMVGAWTEGFFDAEKNQLQPEKLTQLENQIDKKLSIAHYYRGWEFLAEPILIHEFETLQENGWQPMINVNPYYFADCHEPDKTLYKAIADGNCDEFLHRAGKNLSNIKDPFFLLFAWEMNNKEMEWSTEYTNSTPEEFIAAWRRIHTIFKEEGANNALWVFCPNTQDDTSVPYHEIYPGNEYVDWTGIDGYNWGTTQSWSQWSSFSGVFTSSYEALVSLAPNKPMVIAEVNSTDQGGDKAKWYQQMLEEEIPYNFPNIKAVVFYDEDRTEQEKVNWKIDSNAQALQAFKKAINSRFYK